MESALKLKEMAIVHAEGTETWEMASGVATIVGPASVVIAIAPVGPGRDAVADVVRHAADMGRPHHRGRSGAARCPDRRLLPLSPTPSRTTLR